MSGRNRPPRARDRILGAQLRAIRTRRTTLSLEQAAERAQVSLATLSRIENGRRRISVVEVAVLLSVYRVPVGVRSELIEVARQEGQDGVWQVAEVTDHGGLLALESAASSLTEWPISVIPPLLQTPAECAHLRERQARLTKLEYTAFIHESVLRAHLDSRPGRREQILHLIDAVDRGLGVRIVRGTMSPRQVSAYPWTLLEFPSDPSIVALRLQKVSLYLDEPESAAYHDLRAHLHDIACPSRDTQRFLRDLLR